MWTFLKSCVMAVYRWSSPGNPSSNIQRPRLDSQLWTWTFWRPPLDSNRCKNGEFSLTMVSLGFTPGWKVDSSCFLLSLLWFHKCDWVILLNCNLYVLDTTPLQSEKEMEVTTVLSNRECICKWWMFLPVMLNYQMCPLWNQQLTPEKRPKTKRKIVFQPQRFRCNLLVSGRISGILWLSKNLDDFTFHKISYPSFPKILMSFKRPFCL